MTRAEMELMRMEMEMELNLEMELELELPGMAVPETQLAGLERRLRVQGILMDGGYI
jgi:hypothetical protein